MSQTAQNQIVRTLRRGDGFARRAQRASVRADGWTRFFPRRNAQAVRAFFSTLAALADFLTIAVAAAAVEFAYHLVAYGGIDMDSTTWRICSYVAILFLVSSAVRNDYALPNSLHINGQGWRLFGLWNVAFLGAVVLAFLTKSTGESSRGAFMLFYVVGFVAIYAERAIFAHLMRAAASGGGISARRVFLVGFEKDVENFNQRYKPWTCGMNVVAAVVLRDAGSTLEDDLALAAASARMLRPDDVYILAPWSRTEMIDSCVSAFLRVPAQIHLGPERVLDRFVDARIDKIGAISSLSLSGHPLNLAEVLAKRLFDIVGAGLALILLAPALLLVAALIRLDSKGPALFLQRRYGFNQEPFRIVKFRSMTTMDDGATIVQAKSGDMRVTRVGRFIRRWNIDELPQLLNVLRGEMSLVGPRPHALAHDQLFDRRVALYARRHNVKPGITGWAQVNGLRGEIDTPEKIRDRVEHDLYYIDNWSLPFDMWIIWQTVFSRKAYANAV